MIFLVRIVSCYESRYWRASWRTTGKKKIWIWHIVINCKICFCGAFAWERGVLHARSSWKEVRNKRIIDLTYVMDATTFNSII